MDYQFSTCFLFENVLWGVLHTSTSLHASLSRCGGGPAAGMHYALSNTKYRPREVRTRLREFKKVSSRT